MKELEGEQRHSWSDSSVTVLDNRDQKLKVYIGSSTGKSWLTREVESLINDPAIDEGPGAKALKIFPRYGGHH